MKMTWPHMEFVLFFITGPSRAKLGRTAWQQLLTLALLYVSDGFHLILIWNCKHLNKFIGIVMKKWIMNKLITGPIFGSQEKWTVEAFHTLNSGPGTMVHRLWSTQLRIQNYTYLSTLDPNNNKIICPRHHRIPYETPKFSCFTWSISRS